MPLFWVSLAFLFGIVAASKSSIPVLVWCLLAVVALLLALPPVLRWIKARFPSTSKGLSEKLRISSPLLYPLMALFLCLGAIRYQSSLPTIDPSFIAYYNDLSNVSIVEGIVTEPPDVRDTYINLRVKADNILPASESQTSRVGGFLLARIPANVTYKYGDRIRLEGSLQTPPENEDFSYRDYLANHGIYSYLPYPSITLIQSRQGNPAVSWLYAFRERAVKTIYALFPDPEASLISGILLGVQAGISPGLQEAFRLTGTSHIIVISGFNITVIAGLFTYLFSFAFGRYKGAIFTAMGIIFYTLLVGANAAVVRAAILGLLSLVGHLIGRRQTGINSLAFAAGLMAGITPNVLWDVSFQLSFAATLGIMLYAGPMIEWFTKIAAGFISMERAEKLAKPVGAYFLLTLAAQLTTLPLILYYFNRLSLTAIIANPLILPAQPPLMVLGGLAVLVGVFIHPFGQLFAWVAWPFTAYTIRMVEWLSAIPHGSIGLVQVSLPIIVLFYAILFIFSFTRIHIKYAVSKITPAMPLALLAIVAVLTWKAAFSAPDGQLHVTFLDVGTGEGVLIQSPAGRYVLINGGGSTNKLSDALGSRLPYFDRTIDWLVVADIDNEDLAGVTGNLDRFKPENVLWAGNHAGTQASGALWTAISALSIPESNMQAGQGLDLGQGAKLMPLAVNDKGAVFLLEWRNFRLLLPMGIDVEALEALQHNSAMRNISAMLLAESGYAPVNPPELIAQLNPRVVLLSVAIADRSGLPSPDTIQSLEGYNLFRTDRNGWIELSMDGMQMWVEVERK